MTLRAPAHHVLIMRQTDQEKTNTLCAHNVETVRPWHPEASELLISLTPHALQGIHRSSRWSATVPDVQTETTRHTNMQGGMIGTDDSLENWPQLTERLALPDKDIKTALMSIFNVFKKLSRDMEGIEKSKSNVIK